MMGTLRQAQDGGRGRGWSRVRQLTGASMIAVGLILLAGVASYYSYAYFARTQFDDLAFSIDLLEPTVPALPTRTVVEPAVIEVSTDVASLASEDSELEPVTVTSVAFPINSFAVAYPGSQMHPKYWSEPLWAGAGPIAALGLPEGFQLVSLSPDDVSTVARSPAYRIAIPAIGIKADVNDLKILDLGDSQQYETPDSIVGHIPGTANPGEYSNGWYFGHLQSPIRGEGNVFRRLPKISELVKDGDPIYVSLFSDDGEYLYQVVRGEVVRPDELRLDATPDAEITLVTCYPPLVYDHRYVVTARLVAARN